MPTCAQINECMQDLTGLTYSTSEQHSKASQSCIQKDYLDIQTIISFLAPVEPFNEVLELRNIFTGMTAFTGANVDSAKEVSLHIINDMTGKAADTPFGRKIKLHSIYMIDGGWLLQQIPGQLGYSNGPSTKDITHLQRTTGLQCPVIEFSGAMKLTQKKDVFLLNSRNEERIIASIGQKLISAGYSVSYALGDADVLIATTALSKVQFYDACLVRNDTDLQILLIHHCQANSQILHFKTVTKVWHINYIKQKLGNVCDSILFIHTFLGCDPTSTIFGVGKQVALSLALSDKQFQQASVEFCKPGASQEEE
ncbi:hypothetical protein PR048_014288 [Dryococelus australis]|uniref:Uncharacterized protein n=1 Tax=Dryococelus australis TaxID=614101 RepID=A0ABQ9HDS5_9NEOP|nr:hypothetical protein PR048_014288 [Dryococelus australis]